MTVFLSHNHMINTAEQYAEMRGHYHAAEKAELKQARDAFKECYFSFKANHPEYLDLMAEKLSAIRQSSFIDGQLILSPIVTKTCKWDLVWAFGQKIKHFNEDLPAAGFNPDFDAEADPGVEGVISDDETSWGALSQNSASSPRSSISFGFHEDIDRDIDDLRDKAENFLIVQQEELEKPLYKEYLEKKEAYRKALKAIFDQGTQIHTVETVLARYNLPLEVFTQSEKFYAQFEMLKV